MEVKCQDTGKKIDREKAYKVSKTDKNGRTTNTYYSSEEAYKTIERNKNYRQKCIDKMFDVLGYDTNMIMPTYFYKKLKEFEGIGYDSLLDTINGTEDKIKWATTTKQFSNETAKIMYIMAILNNNVMDYYKANVARKKYETEKNRLLGLESDLFIIDECVNLGSTKRNNDVSSLLGDI